MKLGKRSKNSRQRGTTWHGWGKGKAHHKGAGNRGGRGNSGSGKRADHKKPSYWSGGYFGKAGFTSKKRETLNKITIRDLDARLEQLVALEKATKKGDAYEINLTSLGIDKLLGTGSTQKKITVHVASSTSSAAEKLKQAGGSIVSAATEE